MCRADRHRKVSFLVHFGPPILVWLAGIYLLYRAAQLSGPAAERSFGLGVVLVICASMIGSARRSRQTTTRERALELQLQGLIKRVRALEQRVEDVIVDVDTDNAALAIHEAVKGYSAVQDQRKPWMQLVNKRSVADN